MYTWFSPLYSFFSHVFICENEFFLPSEEGFLYWNSVPRNVIKDDVVGGVIPIGQVEVSIEVHVGAQGSCPGCFSGSGSSNEEQRSGAVFLRGPSGSEVRENERK